MLRKTQLCQRNMFPSSGRTSMGTRQWPPMGKRSRADQPTAAVSRCVQVSPSSKICGVNHPPLRASTFQLVRKASSEALECKPVVALIGHDLLHKRFRLGQQFQRARSEIRGVSISKLISWPILIAPSRPGSSRRSIRVRDNRTDKLRELLQARQGGLEPALGAKGGPYFVDKGFSMGVRNKPGRHGHQNGGCQKRQFTRGLGKCPIPTTPPLDAE